MGFFVLVLSIFDINLWSWDVLREVSFVDGDMIVMECVLFYS